jgi:uncharacterized protein YjbI with pentapeptide repeats
MPGAHLEECRLENAILLGADLRLANLIHSECSGTVSTSIHLNGANVTGTSFSYANLAEADFRNAILDWADLSAFVLTAANFTDAQMNRTTFVGTDLSRSYGLENVRHTGPSHIGIDTIYRSGGRIPKSFLRGAGVPESFIQYMPSLIGEGIEFYSLFISYSTQDQTFAERLHADLQSRVVRCWFAPYDMRSGKKIHEQIDEAIRMHDKVLLILSRASMTSEWVKTEVYKARKREITENRRVLFPISLCPFDVIREWECFDPDTGKDSAREIREYFIPDFSGWNDVDSYRKAFDRLMADLHGATAAN